jgi:hypothetical protein
MSLEAVLLMDSHTTTVSVRNQAWTNGWSRLYQIGQYYLDLTLKSRPGMPSVLLGQLIGPRGSTQTPPARIRLTADDGCDLESTNVSARGELRVIPQRAGGLRLVLEFDAGAPMVSMLELN